MNGTLMSDLELERLARPHEDDASLVRELAQRTVLDLGLVAPVDPAFVASYRGIARVEEVDQPWAGCLTHTEGETVARVRAGDNRRRKRFTALHEIEHTYLPGFAVTQYRCDPSPDRAQQDSNQSLETLADVGASELLFPQEEFEGDLAGNRADFSLVEALADHYDASLGATAFRTASLAAGDTLLMCLEPSTKPTRPDDEPVLRIRWSRAKGDWPFIPRFKSLTVGSPFDRAANGELVDETTDLVGIAHADITKVDVSCRLYPYTDQYGETRHRVLCLATRR